MNVFSLAGKKAIVDYLATRTFGAALLDSNGAELESRDGYGAGGLLLTGNRTGTDGETAWLNFDDARWQNAGFSGARYLRIYDALDRTEYAVLDFGADKAGQGADFTYKFPRVGGVIRI
jgi:hypothetical protein